MDFKTCTVYFSLQNSVTIMPDFTAVSTMLSSSGNFANSSFLPEKNGSFAPCPAAISGMPSVASQGPCSAKLRVSSEYQFYDYPCSQSDKLISSISYPNSFHLLYLISSHHMALLNRHYNFANVPSCIAWYPWMNGTPPDFTVQLPSVSA